VAKERFEKEILNFMYDDMNFSQLVIPGLTKPAPYLIRGNPIHLTLVPCFRRDDAWIPAGVYPVLDTGRE
jgi:hypothetical protein